LGIKEYKNKTLEEKAQMANFIKEFKDILLKIRHALNQGNIQPI